MTFVPNFDDFLHAAKPRRGLHALCGGLGYEDDNGEDEREAGAVVSEEEELAEEELPFEGEWDLVEFVTGPSRLLGLLLNFHLLGVNIK